MKVLIIGNGGREYAIARRLKNDGCELFVAPGNAGTAKIATNVDIKGFDELAIWAKDNEIELCVVGPENALSDGVVDIFKSHGLNIFGPSKAAARLEGSKAFMKEFLARQNIRTARFINTHDKAEADEFIEAIFNGGNRKIVVKADGLCAGKGVIIASSADEAKRAAADMLSGASFGDAGKRVVIEEFLGGFELSFFAICDGKNFVSLPVAQDHKRLKDNDEGPNTGGMGAYAPSMLANAALITRVENEIVRPTLDGMSREGAPFCGVLFVGLMVVGDTPYVLEFNVRFGDPECEVLMPLIEGNFAKTLLNAAQGKLEDIKLAGKFAVGVVMASHNYPYGASKPAQIFVENEPEGSHICYAGVSDDAGKLVASGGRVLVAVGLGTSIEAAQAKAYELVGKISFEGAQWRKDIAYQALRK